MKNIKIVFPVLSLMMLVMFSCSKENPVQPDDSQLDTPRFNWQITKMNYFTNGEWCYSFWSPDTNEVFMCSWSNYLVQFKDGQLTKINYGPNIRMFSIDGLSPTEGYIVGAELINGIYTPHIEIWNGISFANVPINYNFDDSFLVSHIFLKSSTEMWISSPNGIVYNFDGYNLTRYKLQDTLMNSRGFLYDENNHLRYLTTYFNTSIDTLQRYYVYEYDGQSWYKAYQDVFPIFKKEYGILKNFLIAYDYPTTIFKLQNNVLVSVVSTPKNTGIASLSGNSLNNIMGFGFTNGRETFFHWNGQKWSDEKVGGEDFTDFFIQKMINDNYVCGIKYGQISTAFLYRGYRKH